MKIKDLSPELRELAVKNTLNPECSHHAEASYASRSWAQGKDLMEAFVFAQSPEGYKFWRIVYSGQFYHPYVLFKYLITW